MAKSKNSVHINFENANRDLIRFAPAMLWDTYIFGKIKNMVFVMMKALDCPKGHRSRKKNHTKPEFLFSPEKGEQECQCGYMKKEKSIEILEVSRAAVHFQPCSTVQ